MLKYLRASLALVFIMALFSFPAVKAAQGTFNISQETDGKWTDIYKEPFTITYQTKTFVVTPKNGQVKIQIVQENTTYADIDLIKLDACGKTITPEYAKYVQSGESVLADISADDQNVIINHDMPVELLWNIPSVCKGKSVLTLKANQYESYEINAFRFPDWGTPYQSYTFKNNGSLNVDGLLTEVDGKVDADYSPMFYSTTGHPSAKTYIYMKDDSDYVYMAFDITGDNTNEYGSDWLKVIAQNPATAELQKEYRIDDYTDTYGKCAFGITSKVSYKHQTCEVKIPKAELKGNQLDFVARYYGTNSGQPYIDVSNVHNSDLSQETHPTIVGTISGYNNAGNVTSVKYSVYNLDTSSYYVLPNMGSCTFEGSDPYTFSCHVVETFINGVNYRVQVDVLTDQDVSAGNTVNVTTYPYTYNVVHSFATDESQYGFNPTSTLTESGGILYGFSEYGGTNYVGAIFSFDPSNNHVSAIHSMIDASEGDMPQGNPLIYNGKIYGVNNMDGVNPYGTIFSVDIDGNNFAVLHSFSAFVGDGAQPFGSIIFYSNKLYGTTYSGGANDVGTLYRFDPNGLNFEVVYSFANNNAADGYNPVGGLVEYQGKLFGVAARGGELGLGVVYSINPDGTDFEIVHDFNNISYGTGPQAALAIVGNTLYGTTSNDGALAGGSLYSVDTDGNNFKDLHDFSSDLNNGNTPWFGPLYIEGDTIYGTTVFGGSSSAGVIYSIKTDGTNFKLLHDFVRSTVEGAFPYGSVKFYNNKLYGMTSQGGETNRGIIYTIEIAPDDSNIQSQNSITFKKDTRCLWKKPEATTWISATSATNNGIQGMNLTWVQFGADKMDIKIDDGTGNYPWKISDTANDGHIFLPNVQSWQKIMIKPINHCKSGDYGNPFSLDLYPNGWYNLDLSN